jgi:hypothetical protein
MDNLSVDFIVQNGKGYKHVESTGTYRGGMGITFFPVKSLTLRVYSDISSKPDVNRISYAGFMGYKYKKKFRLAAEFNAQTGTTFDSNRGVSGVSVYGTYIIDKKFNIFTRYDFIDYYELSTLAVLNPNPWNMEKNGSGPIIGIEYNPVKGVYISTNYRGWQPAISGADYESMVYLNFAFQMK